LEGAFGTFGNRRRSGRYQKAKRARLDLPPLLADLIVSDQSTASVRPWLGMTLAEADGRLVVLRVTPGFGDFVGGAAQPTPARGEDVEKVLAHMDASKDQPKAAIAFKKGDRVKIKTGAFENTDAVVEEVHAEKGMLDVSVNFFGRPTPMSLGYWEVELI
jgi:hypothetical protein